MAAAPPAFRRSIWTSNRQRGGWASSRTAVARQRELFFLDEDRFLELLREEPFLEELRFRGTFPPFFRASERPIAIACLRLFTVPPLPPGPLFSVPFFRRFIAPSTSFEALREYLAIGLSFVTRFESRRHQLSRVEREGRPAPSPAVHDSRASQP